MTEHSPSPHNPSSRGSDLLRTLLWSVLVLAVVANVIASAASADLVVQVAIGAVTAVALVGLVAVWTKDRR
ncbi:hypothetical protein [Aeromicrobium yanjiei]|uniref:Uncharacterized protein n=1 Tax=Aeromicrobium yanjiei TaxID=2662028 RepID=A0A5Q2MFZ0_9ACTN|nr:hypothetical protein [Aeromicrobium yanjiei]QGG40633.1 hypothetical protein GEV26_04225 [Aeromicrobium yanjiei]